jgi:hypothetical protein
VTVTAVDNGGSMDDVADGVNDASEAEEDTMEGQNVQVGTPVQGSTIGDVDPEPSTPIDTHAQSSTPINSQPPQEPSTAINREPRMTKLPKATVVTKSVKIPVKIASESEGVIQQSPAREKPVTELQKRVRVYRITGI